MTVYINTETCLARVVSMRARPNQFSTNWLPLWLDLGRSSDACEWSWAISRLCLMSSNHNAGLRLMSEIALATAYNQLNI